MIKGLKKCGVFVAIDGSEENEICIRDLKNYGVESDAESENSGKTGFSIDIRSSGDNSTIVLSSESGDDSTLSIPFDYISNPEHFSPFTGGFI